MKIMGWQNEESVQPTVAHFGAITVTRMLEILIAVPGSARLYYSSSSVGAKNSRRILSNAFEASSSRIGAKTLPFVHARSLQAHSNTRA